MEKSERGRARVVRPLMACGALLLGRPRPAELSPEQGARRVEAAGGSGSDPDRRPRGPLWMGARCR